MAKTYGASQEYAPKWVSQAQDSRATNYALRAFPNQMAGPRKVDENRCVAAGHLKHGETGGRSLFLRVDYAGIMVLKGVLV